MNVGCDLTNCKLSHQVLLWHPGGDLYHESLVSRWPSCRSDCRRDWGHSQESRQSCQDYLQKPERTDPGKMQIQFFFIFMLIKKRSRYFYDPHPPTPRMTFYFFISLICKTWMWYNQVSKYLLASNLAVKQDSKSIKNSFFKEEKFWDTLFLLSVTLFEWKIYCKHIIICFNIVFSSK